MSAAAAACSCGPTRPAVGDSLWLPGPADVLAHSVLGNLVSNAVKFSPRGETIEISADRTDTTVRMAVLDRGRGIRPETVEALRRGGTLPSDTGTGGERGDGQGLKLAWRYAEGMGGRLELRRRPGGGTEAAVSLPRPPATGFRSA